MSTQTSDAQPLDTPFDRVTAERLAADELARYLDLLGSLSADEWRAPTECPGWDVFAMAGHCLGMAKYAASPEEGGRQQAAAFAAGGTFIDALTALQVKDHANLSPAELLATYREVAPQAVAGRIHMPDEMRVSTMPQDVNGVTEHWTLAYLAEAILTRDVWMHRVDTSRAVGKDLVLTADHDGVLVANVVEEWAGRHNQAFTLHLDGPAGGSWARGEGGAELRRGAVEFCRILSGRAEGDGLLTTEVPF
jgi:uncharacterized protein (TIGR03083 family)